MYVNVMNSGSFTMIQKFLYQYMSRPCKLVVGQDVRSSFRIPRLASAEGPALMAHYFLGCLVMYPDMLVDLKSSSTSSSTEGRKIVMRVETRATKSVDIPLEEWVPMMSSLENSYQRFLAVPVSSSEAKVEQVQLQLDAQSGLLQECDHTSPTGGETPTGSDCGDSVHSQVSASVAPRFKRYIFLLCFVRQI